MRIHCTLYVLLLALILTVLLPPLAATEDATASQIKSEIGRLQQSLKDRPISDKDAAQIAGAADGALKAASAALSAGQIYLALEKLGQAEDLLQGARRMDDKAEVEKGGLTAFQSQWNDAYRSGSAGW
jgi:hypothetical protein